MVNPQMLSHIVKIRWTNRSKQYRILKLNQDLFKKLNSTKQKGHDRYYRGNLIEGVFTHKPRPHIERPQFDHLAEFKWVFKNIKQNKRYQLNIKNKLKKYLKLHFFLRNMLNQTTDRTEVRSVDKLVFDRRKPVSSEGTLINHQKNFPENFSDRSWEKRTPVSIRLSLSGRLNGARMKRKFVAYQGNISTQAFSVCSNYAHKNVYTKWGVLGLRIWTRKIGHVINTKSPEFRPSIRLGVLRNRPHAQKESCQNFLHYTITRKLSDTTVYNKLKKYNPVTPSLRHRLIISFKEPKAGQEILKKFYKRQLIKGLKKTSGRNNQGRITSFRKGGGHKQSYRRIDWLKQQFLFSVAEVVKIEYNPNGSGNIALLKIHNLNPSNRLSRQNAYHYILAPDTLRVGDQIKGLFFEKMCRSFPHIINTRFNNPPLSEFSSSAQRAQGLKGVDKLRSNLLVDPQVKDRTSVRSVPANTSSVHEGEKCFSLELNTIKYGEVFYLKNIPVGSYIYNVEIDKGCGGKIARSAGTYCILLKTLNNNKSIIKLPSNKIIELNSDCTANIGRVSNVNFRSIILGKAGAARWLGLRPKTRGEAMNAVDHPHGGKNHGPGGLRNQPKTRWGTLAKWQKSK